MKQRYSVIRKSYIHFSSLNLEWKTPEAIYKLLDKEFHFDFDPCPIDPKFDGLSIEWGNSNFLNPPYGRQIGFWIKKAFLESKKGKVCVLLIPSRTDTKWFHDYIMQSKDIRFIKGRLNFSNHKHSAPFPSCVVIFK